MADDIYQGIPIRYSQSLGGPLPIPRILPEIAWTKIDTPPREPHADSAVEALMQAAWDGDEPLNAYDDAEQIVAIVRQAIANG